MIASKILSGSKAEMSAAAKVDVLDPQAFRPPARRFERLLATVNSDHGAAWPNHSSGEKGNVARAAAEVEDMHPGANSSVTENVLGEAREHFRLGGEPALLFSSCSRARSRLLRP